MLEVVDLIQVTQQSVTNKVKVAAAALHLILVDCELASCTLSLVKVELRLHLENEFTNLDTDWLQFRSDLVARGHDLAEVVIVDAVKV